MTEPSLSTEQRAMVKGPGASNNSLSYLERIRNTPLWWAQAAGSPENRGLAYRGVTLHTPSLVFTAFEYRMIFSEEKPQCEAQ